MMPIGALSNVPSSLDNLSSPNPTSIVAGADRKSTRLNSSH